MCASSDSQSQRRKQRRGNKYNKDYNLLFKLQTCVRSVEIGKSTSRFLTVRWVNRRCVEVAASPHSESYVVVVFDFQLDGWCRLLVFSSRRCGWMIVAGSWDQASRKMQLDDRREKLRSVEIGKSTSRFLTVRWVNRRCVEVVASPHSESYIG